MENLTLTQEQFENIISQAAANTISKFKEETGMDKVDWKHLMHPGEDEKSLENKNGRERFQSMLKAMATKDFGELKAADPMIAGTDASGGYLVPEVTKAEILRLIPTYGQARGLFSVIPMGKTDTLNLPVKNAGATVANYAENTAIASHKPTLTTLQILAKKFGDIVTLSNEMLADANVDIYNYVVSLFAEALGTTEDQQMFAGTGSPFTGLFSTTHTYGNSETAANLASISYDNLIDMIYGIDQRYLTNAQWLMHRLTFAEVRKIVDSNGRPVVVDGMGSTPTTLFGFPLTLIENAPYSGAGKPVVLLGNFKNSYIGTKGTIALSVSDSAVISGTSTFENDLTAIKVTERIGFNAGLVSAYSALKITA